MLGPLKRIKFLCYANNLLSIGSSNCAKNNFLQSRAIRLGVNCKNDIQIQDETKNQKKKKTMRVPKITLINSDGSVIVTMIENAAKLAKRHNLHLIKTSDVDKSSRDVYKLVSHATYITDIDTIEKGTNKPNNKQKIKKFAMSSKISENDLKTKLNNINKLLKKDYAIKMILTNSEQNNEVKEGILQHIKKNVKGVLSEERKQENNTALIYLPLKDKENEEKSQTK